MNSEFLLYRTVFQREGGWHCHHPARISSGVLNEKVSSHPSRTDNQDFLSGGENGDG